MTHPGQSVVPLRPDAIVNIFRHGHAAPADNDFDRQLSPQGQQQSRALEQTITIPYDVVICSAAPRAEQTAHLVLPGNNYTSRYWYIGTGRQLYCPASDEDFTEVWRMVAELGQVSYGDFLDHDSKGVFGRFRQECLDVIRAIPGIAEARRIVFFNHAVMGNALAEVLFPQHADKLRDINLAPCDGIRCTAETCEHIPLL